MSSAATGLDAAAASQFDAVVTSFDGTQIAITIYRPEDASASSPTPVVLHSHGWSGARIADGSGIVGKLWEAGFGVVTVDARGHGESGGYATVHHKDAEVRDFQAILDWIHDNLDWVQKEPATGVAKDVVAGAAGYSYGGGFQLMTASYDDRLDALAPEITWTDLPYALAPARTVKSVWIDFLYGTAKESGTRIDPRIDDWFAQAMALNTLPQEAYDHFQGSNPLLDEIDADVLFIQGVPDVLFNLNHAIRGYETLEAKGTHDVRLFTHLTGHVLPGIQPIGTSDERRETFADEGPCGTISDLVVAWMDEHLRGGPASGIPEASFALDDGECVTYDALPTSTLDVEVGTLAATAGAGTLLVPLDAPPGVLAGIPRLRATVGAAALETTAFASLVLAGSDGFVRTIDDQTQPVRITPGGVIDTDMAGVATRIGEGDALFLRIDGLAEFYAHNSPRVPGAALLEDVVVTLPLDDA